MAQTRIFRCFPVGQQKFDNVKTRMCICHILSFYFSLNRVSFFGFLPQIGYQFAFTKTLLVTQPSQNLLSRVPLPWKLQPSYNKSTFKIRGYNNQTSWTKKSIDTAGFEYKARQQFSINVFAATVFTYFFPQEKETDNSSLEKLDRQVYLCETCQLAIKFYSFSYQIRLSAVENTKLLFQKLEQHSFVPRNRCGDYSGV